MEARTQQPQKSKPHSSIARQQNGCYRVWGDCGFGEAWGMEKDCWQPFDRLRAFRRQLVEFRFQIGDFYVF
jgi:hypothetical protein